MSEERRNEELISKLPQEGVHCFPANGKQISSRRVITAVLSVAFIIFAIIGLVLDPKNYIFVGIGILGLVISVLVFCQTFLIAKYRVAIDYNEKKVVLRYRYSLISIPFDSFDSYEGEADKAEELLENSGISGKVQYLVLDNVFDEACFQTSTKDLASNEDFFKLKEEAIAIAEAYGARDDEGAIKITYGKMAKQTKQVGDDDIDDIIEAALSDDEKPSEEETKAPSDTEDQSGS